MAFTLDYVGYSIINIYKYYIKGKNIGNTHLKFDKHKQIEKYIINIEKLTSIINKLKLKILKVMNTEVSCLNSFLIIVKKAFDSVSRKIPIKYIIINIKEDILKE